MKVILLQDVAALGRKNEVREVSEGYARNFLIPQGLAEPATSTRLGTLKQRQDAVALKKSLERREYEAYAEKMKRITLRFPMKMGLSGKAFGSVTAAKIAEALGKEGIVAEKEWVGSGEHLKTTGEHVIEIRFPHDIRGKIKVVVEPE